MSSFTLEQFHVLVLEALKLAVVKGFEYVYEMNGRVFQMKSTLRENLIGFQPSTEMEYEISLKQRDTKVKLILECWIPGHDNKSIVVFDDVPCGKFLEMIANQIFIMDRGRLDFMYKNSKLSDSVTFREYNIVDGSSVGVKLRA
jgi:hypothetical protein